MESADGSRRLEITLLEELASGTFARVYLAEARGAGGIARIVAVKVLRQKWTESEEILNRTRDEARLLARLRHKNIVRVEELTELDGQPAIIMEFVEGLDVKQLVEAMRKQSRAFPTRAALGMAADTASALDAAYRRIPFGLKEPLRVVHRDIKPSNIMVSVDGEVKVLDFGTARSTASFRSAKTSAMRFGSWKYMSPERKEGARGEHAADVYALGLVLIELYLDRWLPMLPVDAREHDEELKATVRGIPDVGMPNSAWDGAFRDLLIQITLANPEARPTAQQIVDVLRQYADQAKGPTLESLAGDVVYNLIREKRRDAVTGTLSGTRLYVSLDKGDEADGSPKPSLKEVSTPPPTAQEDSQPLPEFLEASFGTATAESPSSLPKHAPVEDLAQPTPFGIQGSPNFVAQPIAAGLANAETRIAPHPQGASAKTALPPDDMQALPEPFESDDRPTVLLSNKAAAAVLGFTPSGALPEPETRIVVHDTEPAGPMPVDFSELPSPTRPETAGPKPGAQAGFGMPSPTPAQGPASIPAQPAFPGNRSPQPAFGMPDDSEGPPTRISPQPFERAMSGGWDERPAGGREQPKPSAQPAPFPPVGNQPAPFPPTGAQTAPFPPVGSQPAPFPPTGARPAQPMPAFAAAPGNRPPQPSPGPTPAPSNQPLPAFATAGNRPPQPAPASFGANPPPMAQGPVASNQAVPQAAAPRFPPPGGGAPAQGAPPYKPAQAAAFGPPAAGEAPPAFRVPQAGPANPFASPQGQPARPAAQLFAQGPVPQSNPVPAMPPLPHRPTGPDVNATQAFSAEVPPKKKRWAMVFLLAMLLAFAVVVLAGVVGLTFLRGRFAQVPSTTTTTVVPSEPVTPVPAVEPVEPKEEPKEDQKEEPTPEPPSEPITPPTEPIVAPAPATAPAAGGPATLDVSVDSDMVQWIQFSDESGGNPQKNRGNALKQDLPVGRYKVTVKVTGRPEVSNLVDLPGAGLSLKCMPEKDGRVTCQGAGKPVVLQPS